MLNLVATTDAEKAKATAAYKINVCQVPSANTDVPQQQLKRQQMRMVSDSSGRMQRAGTPHF